MNDEVLKIIKNEDVDILRNLLIHLCQVDSRNEDRILDVYPKY